MKKKFKLNNIIPHILAAVTVITIIIACGDGDIINPNTDIKTNREIDLARDILIKYKIDSLANAAGITSSEAETPSSGVVAGESSSSDSTGVDVSSSAGTIEESSSGTADVSSSSEAAPSSSSENPYKLVCDIDPKYNPIFSGESSKFDPFDENDALKKQIPVVRCVRKDTEETLDTLDSFNDVKWSYGVAIPKAEWSWKATNIGEQKLQSLSVYGFDIEECSELTATCGDVTLCFRGSKNPICLSSSSSVQQASSSSAEGSVESSSSNGTEPPNSSSSATGTTTVCEYNKDWCGGKEFGEVIYNSIAKPTSGQCTFFSDFTSIVITGGGGNIRINSATANCTGGSKVCAKPDPKDGGYYVYIQSGSISGSADWIVTPGAKPNCIPQASTPSSSSGSSVNAPWCKIANGCYSNLTPVPPPTYGCTTGNRDGSSPKFQYTAANDGTISTSLPILDGKGWNSVPPEDFAFINSTNETLNRHVYMYEIICNGTTIPLGTSNTFKDGKVHCEGSIDISPNCNPTLACASVTQTIASGATPAKPAVTCGTTPVNTGITWSPTTINSAITGPTTVTGVTATASCGGSNQTATCAGTITVSAPTPAPTLTCGDVTQSITTGEIPVMPDVKCGDDEVTTVITWSPTTINSAINTAQSISNVKATADCGGSSQTANCTGTITVTNPPQIPVVYTLSCAAMPTTGVAGTAINAPAVTCKGDDGSSLPIPNTSANLTWTGAPAWDNPVAGTYSSTSVSAKDGNCASKSAPCSGSLVVNPKLTCASATATMYVNQTPPKPAVTCGTTTVSSSSITWAPVAMNSNPTAAGSITNIKATATCGTASQTADCAGTITIKALPAATCNWPGGSGKEMYSGQNRPNDPTISCSSGTSSGLSFTNLPAATNMVKGTYTPVPTVLCDGVTPSSISSCGTLTVKTAPAISTCAGTVGQTVTLPATPTQPTVTLTDPDNVCSANASNVPNSDWKSVSWTVSKGGTASSNATWANLFTTAGSYDTYKVSGTCGGYTTALTSACTGSATVAPSITYSLSCANVPATGVAGTPIPAPTVTCTASNSSSSTVSSGLTWTNAPNWGNPTANTYTNISVSASSGDCSGKSAICAGTLVVSSSVVGSGPSNPITNGTISQATLDATNGVVYLEGKAGTSNNLTNTYLDCGSARNFTASIAECYPKSGNTCASDQALSNIGSGGKATLPSTLFHCSGNTNDKCDYFVKLTLTKISSGTGAGTYPSSCSVPYQ